MKTITTTLLITQILDIATTFFGLRIGLLEGNKNAKRFGWKCFIIIKIVATMFSAIGLEVLNTNYINLFWFVNFITGIFVINNIYLIIKTLKKQSSKV